MDNHLSTCLACSKSNMRYYTPAVIKDIVGSGSKPYPHGIINSNKPESLERHAVEKSPIPLAYASNNSVLLCLKPSPSCFGIVAADQFDDIRVSEPCFSSNSPICKPALDMNIFDPIRRMTCLPAPPPVRFLKRRKP
jgi:hypothetical protein